MGLDMYLYAKKYIPKFEYPNRVDGALNNQMFLDVAKSTNSTNLIDEDNFCGIQVMIPVGYWRKANAIHGWFVDKHARGIDNCQEIMIFKSDIAELRDICQEILDGSDPSELLPSKMGFFFGSYEYDDWYMEDIKKTIRICDKVLTNINDSDTLIYQASW